MLRVWCILRRYRVWMTLTMLITMGSVLVLHSMLYQIQVQQEKQILIQQKKPDINNGYVVEPLKKRLIRAYDQHQQQLQNSQGIDGVIEKHEKSNIIATRQDGKIGIHIHDSSNFLNLVRSSFEEFKKRVFPHGLSDLDQRKPKIGSDDDGDDDDNDYDDEDDTDDNYEYDDNSYENKGINNKNGKVFDNPKFKPGDFKHPVIFTKPPFRYETIAPRKDGGIIRKQVSQQQRDHEKNALKSRILAKLKEVKLSVADMQSNAGTDKLHFNTFQGNKTSPYTNGIFWSEEVESIIPNGPSDIDIQRVITNIRNQLITKLDPPEWNKCGRAKNGYVHLEDGSPMCARYRTPHNEFIKGEVMSFHLSRLLGMDNVPVVVLSRVNASDPKWSQVARNFTKLEWKETEIVALIQWINNLDTRRSEVYMPRLVLDEFRKNGTLTPPDLATQTLSHADIIAMVQWGEMLLFDYLTGNYDRFASMQDGAEVEKRPNIVAESVRNLKKSDKDGKFWLIDNESGLLDAYELIHGRNTGNTMTKFMRFHKQTLESMCMFRADQVRLIRDLQRSRYPHKVLVDYTRAREPLLDSVSETPHTLQLFENHFSKRLSQVIEWVELCSQKYS